MINWRAYDRILTKDGLTAAERNTTYLQDTFFESVQDNPGYERNARRNGVIQPMLFIRTGVQYKINAVALPGDELYPGDIIEVYDETWICVETRAMDTIQTTGILWLCNHEFKWQNFSSEIHKAWGVFDSGVYSTTRNGDEQLQYLDKQFKIYLPFNEETKKIFVDKRIAVGEQCDPHGDMVLSVYSITGVDPVSRSYGKGAHLLILNARSNVYNPSADNETLGICDYIAPDKSDAEPEEGLICEIRGKKTIAAGKTNEYTAVFYDRDGAVVENIEPQWTISEGAENASLVVTDGKAKLAANKQAFVGATVRLCLKAQGYTPKYKDVEVKAYG